MEPGDYPEETKMTKGAVIIDLGKRKKGGMPSTLTAEAWNAANPAHPRSLANGRFVSAFGDAMNMPGGDPIKRAARRTAVHDALEQLVKETKGERTSLGKALLEAIGRDKPGTGPRKLKTPAEREAGKSLEERTQDWQLAGQMIQSQYDWHRDSPEVVAEGRRRLAEHQALKPLANLAKPLRGKGKADIAGVRAQIAAMQANPDSGDREKLRTVLTGMTLVELKDLADQENLTLMGGNKPEKINNLIESTVGNAINSQAIRRGAKTGTNADIDSSPLHEHEKPGGEPTEAQLEQNRQRAAKEQIRRTGRVTPGARPVESTGSKVEPRFPDNNPGSVRTLAERQEDRAKEMIANPAEAHRAELKTMLMGMTLKDMETFVKRVGGDSSWNMAGVSKKDAKAGRAVEGLIGYQLNSAAIARGIGDSSSSSTFEKKPEEVKSGVVADLEAEMKRMDKEIADRKRRGLSTNNLRVIQIGVRTKLEAARKAEESTVPTVQMSTTPRKKNSWGGVGEPGDAYYHPDGEIGQAVRGLGGDTQLEVRGDSLANVLEGIATDTVAGRMTPKQQIEELKRLRDELPEGVGKRRVGEAIDRLDVQTGDAASNVNIPENAPASMRNLVEGLADIPLMSNKDQPQIERMWATVQAGLDEIKERMAAGRNTRLLASSLRQKLIGSVPHESMEGAAEIRNLVIKAMAALENGA